MKSIQTKEQESIAMEILRDYKKAVKRWALVAIIELLLIASIVIGIVSYAVGDALVQI